MLVLAVLVGRRATYPAGGDPIEQQRGGAAGGANMEPSMQLAWDDDVTTMSALRCCFHDDKIERLFLIDHFAVWSKWLRRAIMAQVVVVVSLNLGYVCYFRRSLDTRPSGFFGDRRAIGDSMADLSMLTPLVLTLCLAMAVWTRVYTARTYATFLVASSLGVLLAFGWPVRRFGHMPLTGGGARQ